MSNRRWTAGGPGNSPDGDNIRQPRYTIGSDGASMPERFARATEFENRVIQHLRRNSDAVVRFGFEHVIPDRRDRGVLRCVNSAAVRRLRYAPDLLAAQSGQVYFVECKCSLAIEREAYKHYCSLESEGTPVLVFLTDGETFYRQRVSHIRFVDSGEYVRRYCHPFDVDAEGWIVPPAGNTASFSRKPFRVCDAESLVEVTL